VISLHQLPTNTTVVIQEITNENLSLTLSELGVMIGEEVRLTGIVFCVMSRL